MGSTYYRDLDGDGQGAAALGTLPATGYTVDNTDCNDACSACRLGATEVCDSRDNDCNGMTDENIGAACTAGVGACQRMGTSRCDGSCTAVGGVPDATFRTTAAPNGSFDWNCDGVVTPQTTVNDVTYDSAIAYCVAQSCTNFYSGHRSPVDVLTGHAARLGGSPYCGSPLWTIDSTGSVNTCWALLPRETYALKSIDRSP